MPITWGEIDAWSRLYRIVPKDWELDLLLELDQLWLKIMAKEGVSADDLREEGAEEDDEAEYLPDPFIALQEP